MLTRILLVVALVYSGLGYTSSETNPLTEVNLQLKWRHQFQFAGYYAALEQGFYQQAGFDVNLLERLPGPTPIEQLIIGDVDYAVVGAGALVYRANGVPLVALAAIYQHSPSILVSRYRKLSELAGKKVMLSAGIMNAEINAMFESAGVNFTDIKVVPTEQPLQGFIGQKYAAFNGYQTNEPFYLEQIDIPYYVIAPSDYGVSFYGDILVTSEHQLATNPEGVARFRAATIKGWQYAIAHVDEIVELILTKYNSQKKSRELLTFEAKALIELIHADIVPIGYMNIERWQSISDILKTAGVFKQREPDLNKFLYSEYLEKGPLDWVIYYKIELLLLMAALLGMMMMVHNSRLKQTIKERTQELRQAKKQAEIDARTDVLTGLANRRHCLEVIEHDLSLAKRNGLALSVIYMDIDWFKKINDQYGHGAGDEALKKLANILKRNVRAADTPARVGGEEFVVICLEKDKQSASHLADRIRTDIQNTKIHYQDVSFNLTVSFGVTAFSDGDSVDKLLQKSDQALYEAKEGGRNKVVCI
ncbi:diguanylate cyclase [Thalassotalea insulae]|uniref:diguanylate cyclase n=1 Tax=Thalassotalea insulae TaxID=2056778 RepID=A0ABQ6GUE2_9GAMM|nr:GGDEF domain-containing protein [Thalassotalea insulae]GLX79512.1 diguanylate cyclase [Thalassotalea insulae]